MKISKLFLGISAAVVIAMSTLGTKAFAADNTCTVEGAPLGKWGSFLTVNGNQITADFVVKGTNCTIAMSLVTWKAPAADAQPLYEQKLYDYKTEVFGPGQHQLTENLPDCFYQADIMVGTKADWAEADNTPKKIQMPVNGVWPDMGLRDFKIGGDKKCEVPTTPKVIPVSTTTPTELTNTGLGMGSVVAIGLGVAAIGTTIHQFVQRKLYS
jgi:hypothetical protein